ncbi:MAG TPA: hypothetical protein PLB05_07120 [Candidatus Omnitrophota bacterium]|nr:hypothetical protein [Candidatus Omnitrophota bacterium]HPN56330.1 hypothetical protein [Candidatus Omnitrophota bacterium]
MMKHNPCSGCACCLTGNHGVIFLTVLILSIILSIVVVSVMSLLVSHQKSGQDVVDQIKSEQFATGMFYRYHQAQMERTTIPLANSEMMTGKNYSYTIQDQGNLNIAPTGFTPVLVNRIQVQINY